MHAQAEALADAFKRDFWAADHEITWTAIEQERFLWLSPETLLIGRVDAQGLTSDRDPFFADWKSASIKKGGKNMTNTKAMWRTDPQALTYGVLLADDVRRFTVRWVIKSNPPTTDFEWYTYTAAELAIWRDNLLHIADDIHRYRRTKPNGPWLLNRGNCYRYGLQYACVFANDCPSNNIIGPPRQPHSGLEADTKTGALPGLATSENMSNFVILSSSRVSDFLNCPEQYRRKWEGQGLNETSEALTVGQDFHEIIANYLRSLMPSGNI